MTLPANIRVNASAPFPARVQGQAYIGISKNNGIWTIGPDYSLVEPLQGVPDATIEEVIVYNSVTGVYNTVPLAVLIAATTGIYRIVTDAGDVQIASTDITIVMNKSVGAPTNIILPPSANRQGLPVTVKDLKQDANTNNITFVPASGETIDGYSATAAAANGVALIDIDNDSKTVYPLASGGWYTLR
jgi:hypothetical protein